MSREALVKAFVTGGAGFIGSNLVDRLLARGDEVVAYDNLSTGRREFLATRSASPRFALVEGDCSTSEALAGGDERAPISCSTSPPTPTFGSGPSIPQKDLEQNTIATFRVLEAMRANGVKRIAFCSTGSVYGEPPSSRRPRTRRSRCRRRSTARRSWPARG